MSGQSSQDERLTAREWQVLALIRQDLTNEQIAERLGISRDGVKYHVSEILSKLSLEDRLEAARWYSHNRPTQLPGITLLVTGLKRLATAPLVVKAGFAVVTLYALLAIVSAGLQHSSQSIRDPLGSQSSHLGKLAYIEDGNLWVKTLPNGTPRQLTTDRTAHSPRWSPSGKWLITGGITYVRRLDGGTQRASLVMHEDGSRQRAVVGCGGWSPTEDVLACVTDESHLLIETPDGTTIKDIDLLALYGRHSNVSFAWSDCYSWSPDGRRLACNAFGAERSYSGIWLVAADGSDALEVTNTPGPLDRGGALVVLSWTGDGQGVWFGKSQAPGGPSWEDGTYLYLVPVTGGEPRRMQVATVGRLQGYGRTELGQFVTVGDGREGWTQKRIGLLDPVSGAVHELTGPDQASFGPFLSPDKQKVAYTSAPEAGAEAEPGITPREAWMLRRIWLMNSDGSHQHQLTQDDAYRDERPLWSKDGSTLLFSRVDSQGVKSLWLIASAGGSPRKVATVTTHAVINAGFLLSVVAYGDSGPIPTDYIAWQTAYAWWQGPD